MSSYLQGVAPSIKRRRSKFDLSHSVKTSMNVGTLYPVYVQEVYPGDTFTVKSTFISRVGSSFIRPVMDNLFLDEMYFYVPSRLVYDDWDNVVATGKKASPYQEAGQSTVPVVKVPYGSPSARIASKTVADYMGIPPGHYTKYSQLYLNGVSVLPFRAFALIWNEWFRDENLVNPVDIPLGKPSGDEFFNDDEWSPTNYLGRLPRVAKFHDYFTSCLPSPQRGDAVQIPLGVAPVATGRDVDSWRLSNLPLNFLNVTGFPVDHGNVAAFGSYSSGASTQFGSFASNVELSSGVGIQPSNLWADLSTSGSTINELRFAFQLQKLLERDSRSGLRMVEYIKSAFGVDAGDYRLQRPEYLGGSRNPLSIQQVAQTSQSTSDSPLAQVGAYSLSSGQARMSKGFVEHGFIIGVACIRQHHTYQQGIERFWFRKERTDFYDPVFSNIGEQPVKGYELWGFGQGEPETGTVYGLNFGYNYAWEDLRSKPNRVTGLMRTAPMTIDGQALPSYDIYHFADYYSRQPVLTQSFIEETPQYVDRALSVPSTEADQFIVDFWHDIKAVRCLPVYSIPGLVDHH